MRDINIIASISSLSIEISEYPFAINRNGNNKFKDQLLKLFKEERSFNADNFIVDAMYVEGIKQGSVLVCDNGSVCMGGKLFSGQERYGCAAILELQNLIRPVIQCKISEVKASLTFSGVLKSFEPVINEVEKQLSGASNVKMEDFISDFRDGLKEIGDSFGENRTENIDSFLEVLSDENTKNYPNELILMFMVFILLMIMKLIEARRKINDMIAETLKGD